MTTTNTFVGIGEAQRVSSRVLKPPGGGSSIVFDEEDTIKPVKAQPQPQPVSAAQPEAPQQAEKQQEQPQQQQQQQATSPKPETNGTATPDCVKGDAAATTESLPSPPASEAAVNGPPAVNGSPAVNGPATVNGSSATNGSMSSGSSSSLSPSSAGALTPTSAKQLNTQNRLFGEEAAPVTPSRRLRDHHRSNIFAHGDSGDTSAHSATPRPAAGNNVSRPSEGTPETKTPEQSQPQVKQRQRVPPGGFSTQLW